MRRKSTLAACSMPSTIVSGSVSNSSELNSPSSVVLSMGGVMLCPSLVSRDGVCFKWRPTQPPRLAYCAFRAIHEQGGAPGDPAKFRITARTTGSVTRKVCRHPDRLGEQVAAA